MFTGLVQGVGAVVGAEPKRDAHGASAMQIFVDVAAALGRQPAPDESICVNGCCLTVAGVRGDVAVFDVAPETLTQTTLGALGAGARVNLEACVTPTTLLGGHIVQGHVDGVGRVTRIDRADGWRVRIEPPSKTPAGDLMQYATPKGSVTIEGVSLTLAAVNPGERWFEVALIPTTLEGATLGALEVGAPVNLEMDVLAKTAVHWLRHYAPGAGTSP